MDFTSSVYWDVSFKDDQQYLYFNFLSATDKFKLMLRYS